MKVDLNSIKPIYLQIAEGIEEDILSGILKEQGRAYSQYQVAKDYNINPATAAKGIKRLEDNGTLYKKRGIGMFVSEGAVDIIKKSRKEIFLTSTLKNMMLEAVKIGFSKKDIIKKIEEI